ncbi:MAG: PhnD/SsuA/transferrin family substrate-binding protein [Magnetococcales bacterium]|nr:PhnD/SsuA/transferrin family substrate-binding protein [Magnetococcales bacterium]
MLRLCFYILAVMWACVAITVQAESPLTLGVLAYRPLPETLTRWQPLAQELSQALNGRLVQLRVAGFDEMEKLLAANQLDFVLTNPSHFIQLRNKNTLSGALASMITLEQGVPVSGMGGVILTRADHKEIFKLSDLQGKRIHAVLESSLGGYQAQIMELVRKGLPQPDPDQLSFVRLPHDKVIENVLMGRADVGFVRTGLIESMAAEGRLDPGKIRVINPQELPGFPFAISTQLYPEWPFVALPHASPEVARRVAATLLTIEPHSPAARAAGILGFGIPADYSSVEELARTLRLPPYDTPPTFTFQDVWGRYRGQLVSVIGVLSLLAFLSFRLWLSNRHLKMVRRQAEEQANALALERVRLAESEEKFRTLVETTADWIWEMDTQARFTYASPRIKELLGYEPEELVGGLTGFDLMPEEEAEKIREEFQVFVQEVKSFTGLININRHKDGHLVTMESNGKPFFDARGNLQGYRGADRDITQRLLAEQALRRERDFISDMVNALPGIFYVIDGSQHFQMWNHQLEEITGADSDEMTRVSPLDFFRGEERELVAQRIAAVFINGFAKVEASIYHRNGTSRPYYFVGHRVDRDGHPLLIGMGLDISEHNQVKEDLRQAKELAEKANLAKGEFLATMSHEIRTPMNVVLGMSGVLLESELSSEQRYYVELMHKSGKALLGIINDILDYSRIESGQFVLAEAPFSPKRLVMETVQIMRLLAEEKGLVLTVEVMPDVPGAILGDDGRIRQILINLLGNAVKFTQQGHVKVGLSVHLAGENQLLFSVSDTGIGIEHHHLERIFQHFTQVDSGVSRRFGGAGLGLSISKSLVELMGGKIWVESQPDHGSVFYFTLPMRPVEFVEAGISKPKLPVDAPIKRIRILIVEDSEDNQMLFKIYLKNTPHQIVIANDGQEAIFLVKKEHFDLVLMDIQMPIMDGYTATRAIRQWEEEAGGKRLTIIALSAHASAGRKEESLTAGCDDHLTKPIHKQALLAEIQKFINTLPAD